jgi:hypothetical protein
LTFQEVRKNGVVSNIFDGARFHNSLASTQTCGINRYSKLVIMSRLFAMLLLLWDRSTRSSQSISLLFCDQDKVQARMDLLSNNT